MVNVSVARRYARALLEASGESAALGIADRLSALAALFAKNSELSEVVTNPAYSRTQRHGIVEGLIRLVQPEGDTLPNFLRLLVDRNRLGSLPDIARLFRDMADARAGRVRGVVTSAVALEPESIRQLERTLSQALGRQVVLDTRVDASLIGGVSTQVGSVVFDGTLRSQLDELGRVLRG